MNILHTISFMGIKSGGPPLSTYLTVKGLRNKGINAEILSHNVSNRSDKLLASESWIHLLPSSTDKIEGAHIDEWLHYLFFSKKYKDYLLANQQSDLYHIHGVWLYTAYITAKIARKYNKPYIIAPRGSLYPQDLKKASFLKKIFLELYQWKDLQKAACIQATCMEEMMHIRNLGISTPIAVIPNPIEISDSISKPVYPKDKLRIGYLGRVHRRKKIERLIYAWGKLGDLVKDMELVIIGAEDSQYMDFLKAESARLHLNNVVFTGFLTGKDKDDALSSLSCLAVPSDFENFGNIITEALVRGIPVIASKGTPWEELNTCNCGWWVDNDVDTLAHTMEKSISLPDAERVQMGLRGQALMKNNYSIEIIAQKMKTLYEWILIGAKQPDFVFNENYNYHEYEQFSSNHDYP
jgi:glycosyltransferase involved in cell wall biosynthesis